MVIIPPDQLRPATLQTLIEEFITRDGSVQGHADLALSQQAQQVLCLLKTGQAVIVFDEATESCTIIPAEQLKTR